MRYEEAGHRQREQGWPCACAVSADRSEGDAVALHSGRPEPAQSGGALLRTRRRGC